ncbi:MAG: response regulator [Rhodospirillaceae bacterium]|jgi:CheY-like chemotaxis protein|nr:response regulator [Rhodospirillaceae bacterium]MBT5239498.1 response regulator [Rhodospirillaceae bacterium]MBT5564200.1 response regulator [Rhodospirillaceae bacterium]MBT6089287.1 response regulator [Rhodospirillaceae bacterium]MBT7451277.1 response regulator [Rhodospirillaceae bacterium]
MAEMPQREQTSFEEDNESDSGTSVAGVDAVVNPDSELNEPTRSDEDRDASSESHLQASDAYSAEHVTREENDLPIQEDGAQVTEPEEEYEAIDSDEDGDLDEDLDEDGKPRISFANKRVLLIEDEVETIEILTAHLKEMGVAEVIVTQNAGGALNQLLTDREKFPHLVVLELALIGMDGIQFLAQLRAHKSRRLQELPAVVITTLDSPSIYRRAARQKVGAFLRKPVSIGGLKKGMEDALRGEIVEQPFSQPKSWLDDIEEEELRAKREAIKAKASAKVRKLGLLARVLDAIVPWSGKA